MRGKSHPEPSIYQTSSRASRRLNRSSKKVEPVATEFRQLCPSGREGERCNVRLHFGYCYVSTMSRVRYLMRLTGEFAVYARVNRTWWVPPLLLLLAIAFLLITVGHAAAPYALYPLF